MMASDVGSRCRSTAAQKEVTFIGGLGLSATALRYVWEPVFRRGEAVFFDNMKAVAHAVRQAARSRLPLINV
jgi:hypothetical protein